MKVQGNKIEKVSIEVDNSEIKRIITEGTEPYGTYINAIYYKFLREGKLPLDAFLQDGKWMHEVEHYGSHSWCSDETIRDATEDEIQFLAAIRHFRESILIDNLK